MLARPWLLIPGMLAAMSGVARQPPDQMQPQLPPPATSVALEQAHRMLTGHQEEVRKLSGAVARQESTSRHDDTLLQKQDQVIADLQRQLKAIHQRSMPKAAASASGR